MLRINGSARTPGAIELFPATIASLETYPPTEESLLTAAAVGVEIGQRLIEDDGNFKPISVLTEIGSRYPRIPVETLMALGNCIGDSMKEHLDRGPAERILARDMRHSFNGIKGFAMDVNDRRLKGMTDV